MKGSRGSSSRVITPPRTMLSAGSSSGLELFLVIVEPGWNGERERLCEGGNGREEGSEGGLRE